MKQEWSRSWQGSTQPRKQRKFRANAPLHVRHKLLTAHLSPDLRRETGRRALPLRKGDEVIVLRGGRRGSRGSVETVDMKRFRATVEGVKTKKVDGSEASISFITSHLMITRLNLDDKRRKAIVMRKKRVVKETRGERGAEKETKKNTKNNGSEKQHSQRKDKRKMETHETV